ncbi:MAG: diphthamide synthesis protein [Candidatus Pacearchaeota archaeon]|jgi:diphthamide biosynthesis enzyme Dph1/Dph2-like protein
MKTLYIPTIQKNLAFKLSQQEITKLPKKLFLVYSIQYQELASNIAKQLEKNNIKIQQKQQVLGCSNISNKNNLPILLIGTGRFHAENLMLQTPILYVLEDNKIIQIPQSEINSIKAKKQTALIKFFKADKLGILVSTKPGQESLNKAIKLKKQLETQKNPKQAYIFISNNIDIAQFENFNISSWVNTACKGLAMDNPNIINMEDLPK